MAAISDKYSGLSAAQARELLAYDPETGILTWKVSRGKAVVGREAGSAHPPCRYRCTGIYGRAYKNHRLAWLIHYGRWPDNYLDHIDGDIENNRIGNLRPATASTNQHNKRASFNSKTGVLGVFPSRGKYQSSIRIHGNNIFLGRFNTIEDASNAYLKAKRELHEGNTL